MAKANRTMAVRYSAVPSSRHSLCLLPRSGPSPFAPRNGRTVQPDDHRARGGLPGAVRARKPVTFPGCSGEGDIVHRRLLSIRMVTGRGP